MGIRRLCLQGYSRVIIKQVSGRFALKEIALVAELHSRSWSNHFQVSGSIMCHKFTTSMLIHQPLCFESWQPWRAIKVKIVQRPLRGTYFISSIDLFIKEDWDSSIIQNFNHPFTTVIAKSLENFVLNGELYIEAVVKYSVVPYPQLKRKKNPTYFMIFYVEIMIPVNIDTCRVKDSIALKWLRCCWIAKGLYVVLVIPRYR